MSLPRLIPRSRKTSLIVASALLLSLLAAFGLFAYSRKQPVVREINYTQLRELAEAGGAASVKIDGEVVIVTAADGTISTAVVPSQAAQQDVATSFLKNKTEIEYKSLQPGVIVTALGYLFP